jgi:phage shock protein E
VSKQRRSSRPPGRGAPATPASSGSGRRWAILAGGIAVVVIVLAIAWVAIGGQGSATGGGTAWTDISPDQLASGMDHKDFTLLNVKTPYIGEIDGTDLYIPYDQLAARQAELPADRAAPIVVYCRSGRESAVAARTLADLGYTEIENLSGGMQAWVDSGRSLVQRPRT